MAISAAEIIELDRLSDRDGVQNKAQRLGQVLSVNDSKSGSANTSLSTVASANESSGVSRGVSLSTVGSANLSTGDSNAISLSTNISVALSAAIS